MVRCCKDAQWGAGSTSPETPIPEDPNPRGCIIRPCRLFSPQGPLPCPRALPGSQASPARGEGWSGRGLAMGAAGEGGIYRQPSIAYWPWASIFTL